MTDRVIRVVLDGSGVRRGAIRTKKELQGIQGKVKGVQGQFKAAAAAAGSRPAPPAASKRLNRQKTQGIHAAALCMAK